MPPGAQAGKMATVADELLNDFEDSGDENEEEQPNDGLFDNGYATPPLSYGLDDAAGSSNSKMELDGDEEELDEDLESSTAANTKMMDAEGEEEAKARVEKMQLGSVNDVRSVASLMKTLEPVMEVSTVHQQRISRACIYNLLN